MNFQANTDPNLPSIFDIPRKNRKYTKYKGKKKINKHTPKNKILSGLVWNDYPRQKQSASEVLISTYLEGYQIKYYREVSFDGLKSDLGGILRFDFYLPSINVCIEYDGEQFHNDWDTKIRDSIKTSFCLKNKIRLIRYDKTNWHCLEMCIDKLMREFKIPSA